MNVLSSTLNGRLQHLRMDEKEKEEVEFLKHAAAWLPSNRDLDEDDAFYFSQKVGTLFCFDIISIKMFGHSFNIRRRKIFNFKKFCGKGIQT